jgi:hypothetical protein
MTVFKGKPLKAFSYQDHDAHIAVHRAVLQDPMIAQVIGQNPQAQQIQAALTAHIAEHVGYSYRRQIEARLGVPLPPEDEKLPPQVELALSGMMAQAAQQVLQQAQQQAAQMQAQQQAQDPVVQMQMQELQLKAQELELKKAKVAVEAAAQAEKLQIEEAKVSGTLQIEAMKTQASIQDRKLQMEADQLREGLKIGLDIAKDRQQTPQNTGNQPNPPARGQK